MNLANKLTIFRVALVPLFIIAFYVKNPYWQIIATLIFTIACVTDAMDGYIARKRKIVTDFGKIMDTIADKMLVTTALVLLVEWSKIPAVVAIVLLCREFLVTGIRLVAAASDGTVISAGWIGKLKTLLQYVGIGITILEDIYMPINGVSIGVILIYISMVLSIWSGINYVYYNRAVFKSTTEKSDKEP